MRQAVVAPFLAFTLVTCSLSLARASSWLMAGHDAQNTGFNSGERVIGPQTVGHLHRAWSLAHVTYLIATDQRVFATTAHRLLVLDARTGKTLRSLGYTNPLAYASGRLLASTGAGAHSTLVALNPGTGRVLWRAPIQVGSIAVAGNRVYTGYGCQNTPDICGVEASYAVDLRTGKVLWKHAGNFGGQPALIAGHLYQTWSGGYGAGYTAVYDPQSGQLLARLPLAAQWLGNGRTAWANVLNYRGANTTSWVGQIGPSGKAVWKVSLGKAAGGSVLAYGTVFSASHRFQGGVLAVNAANGHVRWASTAAQDPVAAANHVLLANHNGDGPIAALNAETGKTLAQIPGGRLATAIVAGGAVYVTDINGLTAFRP